ncbi:histidine kinase [Hymenobacter sp. BT664]|uniref:Histidine kinase n=1 Tax=Hymenobacter montanus TaxID=2771359 RepID=A0A927GJP8_9BACT|nr:histidine kinase [Hymenobacter montanus]MBD2768640.1 histidine kinase [Hymenobacter montanus]
MNDRLFRLWGIPALALLITLSDGPYNGPGAGIRFMMNGAFSLGFTVFFWLGNRALWGWLLRRLPRVEQTPRRLWMLAGLSVAFTGAGTVLLTLALNTVLPKWFPVQPAALFQQIRFNLLPTIVVLTLYEAIYFFQQWEQNVRRADQMARATTQAQLDALLSQLDPHFLFNNLNTLSALIEPGNLPAQQFVEQLADVYRYVLLAQGQPTVPLAEELAFVETYLALHKVRFRENLVVEIAVLPPALARRVAPLSVQVLVENALKHNVASREHPLHLRLATAADAPHVLLVENTLRPRLAGLVPGTGTGLPNVRRRYELLGAAQAVEVQEEAGRFIVKLPLI